MVPAATTTPGPLAPDRARVVFFRASWEADPPPYDRHAAASRDAAMAGTVIVDEQARVVGTVTPGSFVVADVDPGDHLFFAEDARQLDASCITDCLAFGAARAHLEAGRTYGVQVQHPNRFAIGGDLGERHRLDLVRADGAPLGRPGWTWLRLEEHAGEWARDHADRLRDIVRAGSERMRRPDEWDARASNIGP